MFSTGSQINDSHIAPMYYNTPQAQSTGGYGNRLKRTTA